MNRDGADEATFNIGIFIYEEAELLDFCGPFEVLSTAAALATGKGTPWQVFTVGEQAVLLRMSGGLLVQPEHSFAQHPRIDLLLIPGGWTEPQVENPVVVEWVRAVTAGTQIATSVCTGAFLLGAVGLLDGREVTTHMSALDGLATGYPAARVQREVRWVDQGPLVMAAGVSAGIDMSLHLVERLLGREVAEQVARYMEYTWQEN